MTTWNWTVLRAGPLLLDGGSMFGVVPRVVWTRTVEPDDKNRITLSHNCVLLESSDNDPDLGRPRRVLVEAGTGDKLDPKMSKIFGLDGTTVESALVAHGVDPSEIDHAVVSHLHFDHAGGLTRRAREGETPDWEAGPGQASGDCDRVKLTLPNARVVVQRREWDDAMANTAVMTRTYYRDHLEPLMEPLPAGGARLHLLDSPPPFPGTRVPKRSARPEDPVEDRMTEILPGLHAFLVPGHTWGQQAIAWDDPGGNRVVFTPDVLPSAWHLGAAYSLAYDVEPYTSMLTKRWFLAEAADRGWTLVLDHEPGNPVRRVNADGEGWYTLDEAASGA
ncbi:MAG: MBL fold metallo-hydrolase [Phycisphaerales bacterium JB040]